jgi:hypothetical protein
MQQSLNKMTYLVGDAQLVEELSAVPAKEPFADDVCDFLNEVSKILLKDTRSRIYSDVITLGFWMRKASLVKLKNRFLKNDGNVRLGRGVAFHIAPSNVPVNFAYSLVTGLLTGNSNIVRIPSKDFPQVEIIAEAINKALCEYKTIKSYIILVRYERDAEINDVLSALADTRIVWGGDATIAELRKSPLPPRSAEITFADRYSLSVIDSDTYMKIENKEKVAQDFYNDTYFTDQNACTSPRIVVWTGNKKEEAKRIFWEEEHKLVKLKYTFQPIQGVNKLTSSYLIAMNEAGVKIENFEDNLIFRISVPKITDRLMDFKDNCGYFFEYDCDDILELKPICDNKRCQTVGLLGEKELLVPLLKAGVRGIDRVVPIGKTMDFDLIWDGYDLLAQLTRMITFV